jgi:anti-anti-sigma factor
VGDTAIVAMDGVLDFEGQEPFQQNLNRLLEGELTDSVPKQIIFDLENLEFVGSSGISTFIQTLRDFNARAPQKPRYYNVKSEFIRVIQAFDHAQHFDFHDANGSVATGKKHYDQ